jgi:hypothetical protein
VISLALSKEILNKEEKCQIIRRPDSGEVKKGGQGTSCGIF